MRPFRICASQKVNIQVYSMKRIQQTWYNMETKYDY